MVKANIGDIPRQDLEDIVTLHSVYMDAMRCIGGRLVHSRYCCTHCESGDPEDICHSAKIVRNGLVARSHAIEPWDGWKYIGSDGKLKWLKRPVVTRAAWRKEVANKETELGYEDWKHAQLSD